SGAGNNCFNSRSFGAVKNLPQALQVSSCPARRNSTVCSAAQCGQGTATCGDMGRTGLLESEGMAGKPEAG
ncbi:MAG: hypothetical protein ACK48X_13685, partial [Planctomycetota bacterium]